MQRSLVQDWTRQKRIAVLLQRDGQAVKPVCPLLVQVVLDPDLIGQGLAGVGIRVPLV